MPWAAHARTAIGLLEGALLGVVILVLAAGLAMAQGRRRRPRRSRHDGVQGAARFLSEPEIRRRGLLPAPEQNAGGVYLGAWADGAGILRHLRHDGPEHCLVIAPPRSGKEVGNILPTLLSWPGSALIYDQKGELWQLTAGWRGTAGENVVIRWEPGAIAGSAGFNFLEEVRLGTPHEVADVQDIAQMLCDTDDAGIEAKDHWGIEALEIVAALVLHVLYEANAKGTLTSLADVAMRLSGSNDGANAVWEDMCTNRHQAGAVHPFIAGAGRAMLDRPARERTSILNTARSNLTLVKAPIVAANTHRSDFRIADLMDHERPVSLYMVARGSDKERLRPLIRLLLTMAMRRLMSVELRFENGQAVMSHRHRLLMMLDEFPSLGRLQIVQDALPACADYGIKALLAVQNREQLFAVYGPDESISADCRVRIVYAPAERETAAWISKLAGSATSVIEDVVESSTQYDAMRNVSRRHHEVGRRLVTPDEIMALRTPLRDPEGWFIDPGELMVLIAGERPILGTPILYYLDRNFGVRATALPPPVSGVIPGAAPASRGRT